MISVLIGFKKLGIFGQKKLGTSKQTKGEHPKLKRREGR